MKKILVYSVATLLSLALIGCGTSTSDATISDLSAQLDRVSSSVEQATNIDTSPVEPTSSTVATYNTSALGRMMSKVSDSLDEEQDLAEEIEERVGILKQIAEDGGELKLTKNKIQSIRTLTNAISSDVTKLSNTKTGVASTLSTIRKYSKGNNISTDQLSANYTKLGNLLDSRVSYMNNILTTMDTIEEVLGEGEDDESDDYDDYEDYEEGDENEYQGYDGSDEGFSQIPIQPRQYRRIGTHTRDENGRGRFHSYAPNQNDQNRQYSTIDNQTYDRSRQNSTSGNRTRQNSTSQNGLRQNSTNYNYANGNGQRGTRPQYDTVGYGVQNQANQNYNRYQNFGSQNDQNRQYSNIDSFDRAQQNSTSNYGYGAQNYDYGQNYGYNGYYGREFDSFNPSRNTDTYRPNVTNIDTYRPNGYYGGSAYNDYNGYYYASRQLAAEQNQSAKQRIFDDQSATRQQGGQNNDQTRQNTTFGNQNNDQTRQNTTADNQSRQNSTIDNQNSDQTKQNSTIDNQSSDQTRQSPTTQNNLNKDEAKTHTSGTSTSQNTTHTSQDGTHTSPNLGQSSLQDGAMHTSDDAMHTSEQSGELSMKNAERAPVYMQIFYRVIDDVPPSEALTKQHKEPLIISTSTRLGGALDSPIIFRD